MHHHQVDAPDALPARPPATAGQPAPHETPAALGPPTDAAVGAADVGADDAASAAAAEKERNARFTDAKLRLSQWLFARLEAEALLKEREARVAAYAVELGVAV